MKTKTSFFPAFFLLAVFCVLLNVNCFAQNNRLWATYYGGADIDFGSNVVTDISGNVYLAGVSLSTSNIASGGFQNTYGGGYFDSYLVKFSPSGTRLWATYYGGLLDEEQAGSIAIDGSGNVYLAGLTNSSNNISAGGFQNTFGGGPLSDAFLVKFDGVTGNRLWATYYGDSMHEYIWASVAIDPAGNVYLAGSTESTIGINSGGFQNTFGGGFFDAFLVKFDGVTGNRLWATYYGGAGLDWAAEVTTDASGNVYLSGVTNSSSGIASGGFQNIYGGGPLDAFLVKFNGATGNRIWATYYGGSGQDLANDVVVDASGNIYLVGITESSSGISFAGFQNTFGGGLYDAFLVKFDGTNGSRVWATYYGGTGDEENANSNKLVVDIASGNIYLCGSTNSPNNIASGGFQNTLAGSFDAYLVKFDPFGNRLCATYYGSTNFESAWGLDVDVTGNIYLCGSTESPVAIASGGFQNIYGGQLDAFLIKLTSCTSVLSITTASTNVLCNSQCTGSATAIPSNGTSPYTYLWGNGQTTSAISGLCAGTYSVLVSDAVGSTTTSTVTITQPSAISINSSATSVICGSNNGSATINGAGGTPGYTYNWNPSGQNTQTATGLGAGNYTATITDANGCTKMQTVTVASTMNLAVSSTPTGCTVNNGTASAIPGSGTSPFTYNWNNGQSTQTSTGLGSGNYIVIVTDASGCIQTQTISVTQIPGPLVTASANANAISLGDSTVLTATGGGSYSWSPVTGLSCDTCVNPTATPSQTTSYCVLVTDTNGCTATACVNIEILCEPIYIPNAFSPNNDLENDMECVFGSCIEKFHLVIYNRWGEKVFESDDQAVCWDGTFRGTPLNTAVFNYYLQVTLTSGEKVKKKGNISLIR